MLVPEIKQRIGPVLREHGVLRASVFGSVARGHDRPDSDIDLMVKLGKPMGLFAYMKMLSKLEDCLGRKVDLVTESSLNKHVKPFVLPELKTVYEI